MSSSSEALALHGVAKAFGEHRVLRDASLALPAGRTMALIGPSASGKSVLMKCAGGLMPVDAGRIDVLGEEDVQDFSDLRPRIGILFQRNALFDGMRVWENVAFPLRRPGKGGGMPKRQAEAEALELLEAVGLGERSARGFPKDLSGGMQKRAALARALVGSPDLLLLDDPTAGLDPVLAASIEQLIRVMVRRERAAALIVTADVKNLAERFDHVAILDGGCVQWSGPSEQLQTDTHPLLEAA